MAIYTARTSEDWKARKSEKSLQDGITGTRLFNVYSDTEDETEANVYSAVTTFSGVDLGVAFPGAITALCVSMNADRNSEDRLTWTVTCQFKSVLNQLEQSRIDYPNPLDRTAKITWSARTVQTAVTRMQMAQKTLTDSAYTNFVAADYVFNGYFHNVANTMNDPFDPPLEVPVTEWIATITKNITSAPSWFGTYENAVNNADVTLDGLTITKGCGKLEGIKLSEKMKENGTVYRQLSFNIIVRPFRPLRPSETDAPEPWDVEVLNEGMRTFGATSGWKNITDTNGNSVSKPVPLNRSGAPIDPSGAPIPESSLYWMLFRPFNRKDFSVLPLT